ncbi:Hypothetical_protein [Hexamita inflata]|uniref:Hypothetical_protein n=1 Tax=Hexamita inflata TaxID=28002 RepID=A0AA86P2C0_9EUKA|nr:Hypothetical protein HINF_LOCUS16961 [Hexamita inflata]
MLCMKAPSRRSKVRETVKLPEELKTWIYIYIYITSSRRHKHSRLSKAKHGLVISFGLHERLFRCIGIAWWWLPLMHWFINLIRFLCSVLVYLFLQILISEYIAGGRLAISQGLDALVSSLALYFQINYF